MTRPSLNRPAALRLGAYALFVAVGVGGMWRVETVAHKAQTATERIDAETEQRLQDGCERWNANRHDSRELMRRGDLESGEVLIEVVSAGGTTPEELAVIEAYRRLLGERQAAIVEEHSADDRDCEAERVERAKVNPGVE